MISLKDIRNVPVIEPSSSSRHGMALLVTGTPHKNNVQIAAEKKWKVSESGKQKPK